MILSILRTFMQAYKLTRDVETYICTGFNNLVT